MEQKIIAHRGLCNVFPQNSIEAIEAALLKADLVQFDVLLTKDQKLIVFHDRGLQRLTNVSQFPEFANRKRKDTLNDKEEVDWWVNDFTLQQLKQLKISQTVANRPQLKRLTFKIPSLEEVFQLSLNTKSIINQSQSGLLIQLKCYRQKTFSQYDKILVKKVIQSLEKKNLCTEEGRKTNRLPIIIQSFCQEILQQVNNLIKIPIVRLCEDYEQINYQILKTIKMENLIGIGITQCHLRDNSLVQLCARMNYQVFYWTVRDDDPEVPFKLKNYKQVYHFLTKIGINGIITQFPQNCRMIKSKQLL